LAMTLMLAGCTSSTSPPTTTSNPSTKTISRVDLDKFVALAHKGLSEPFEATYRLVYPKGTGKSDLHDFRIWSEPPVGSDVWGNFVYEAPFGSGTFRFIENGRDDYECLRAAPEDKWSCVGPYYPTSNDGIMQVEGYRYPMWVAGEMTTALGPPLTLSYRVVLGRRLWCQVSVDTAWARPSPLHSRLSVRPTEA
jgi:hypothetical protein